MKKSKETIKLYEKRNYIRPQLKLKAQKLRVS